MRGLGLFNEDSDSGVKIYSNNPEKMLECINESASEIRKASPELLSNREFIMAVINVQPSAIVFLGNFAFSKDKEIIALAVKKGVQLAIACASEGLQTDPAFVLELIAINPSVLGVYGLAPVQLNVSLLSNPNFKANAVGVIRNYVERNTKSTAYEKLINEIDEAKKFAFRYKDDGFVLDVLKQGIQSAATPEESLNSTKPFILEMDKRGRGKSGTRAIIEHLIGCPAKYSPEGRGDLQVQNEEFRSFQEKAQKAFDAPDGEETETCSIM